MTEENEVKQTVENDMVEIENKGHRVFLGSLFGSQNYGIDTSESDIDTKIIIIPTLDNLINENLKGKTYKRERKEEKEGNITVVPLNNFFRGLKNGNINYLELLFSPYCFLKQDSISQSFLEFYEKDIDKLPLIDINGTINSIYGMSKSYYNEAAKKGVTKKLIINLVRLKSLMKKIENYSRNYNRNDETQSILNLFIPDKDAMEFIARLRNDSFSAKDLIGFLERVIEEITVIYKNFKEMFCNNKEDFLDYALKEKIDKIKKDIIVYNILEEIERIKNEQQK